MKRIMMCACIVLIGIGGTLFSQERIKVVTTLNYLRYFVQEIGGDRVNVIALSNPKQDPHYVTPTPRMNEITRNADLFIENGLSLDLWAKNVIDASGNPTIQRGNPGHLLATLNVPILELPSEISRSWGDIHPQGNPHVWLDPLNVKIIAGNIANRLATLDHPNASYYFAREEAFKERIDKAMFGEELLTIIGKKAGDILARKSNNDELESWLKSKGLLDKLGGWMKQIQPIKGKNVVTYHKTYVYLAHRFRLSVIAELEEKPGIPPPPQRRDAIVDQMKREGVKVIMNDNFYSQEAADYVADKTGAEVLITYIEVGASDEVPTYEKLIDYFIQRLVIALQ